MKTYYLRRHEDVSGNSGCGRVAQVAEFDDGAAVLHWTSGANTSGVSSTEVFASVADLLRVHGHDGRSVLEPIAEELGHASAKATVNVEQAVAPD